MDHRNITTEKDEFSSVAIDNIISRGSIPDWVPLLNKLQENPYGAISERVLKVCHHNKVYGSSAVFVKAISDYRKAFDCSQTSKKLDNKTKNRV